MRGSTAALMAAAALLLSPALLMLRLVSPAEAPDAYEQETRRMFAEWKAKYRKTYKYAGEEECRYAVFKEARRRVARAHAAGVTTSGLSGHASEEVFVGYGGGPRMEERAYEEETRRIFAGWKARHGKAYRDAGEEECRYNLFKANRRVVVGLNAAAADGETSPAAYGLNQFGDLTNEEVRESCGGRGGEMMGKLSARCRAAVAGDTIHELIRSQLR
ncbi:hypothetical protein PVAP13_3KG498800 [Panicum virgatum]|uniref:Cathepsin propeptide inhibitor domain-containing protein n=2 Tax=Panicum virgatum TaxID=38727 RepID=A0A8T0V141_PANVG|nr:hypothetical protein PVAP13_3KG498800 [Panicum virgatum]